MNLFIEHMSPVSLNNCTVKKHKSDLYLWISAITIGISAAVSTYTGLTFNPLKYQLCKILNLNSNTPL